MSEERQWWSQYTRRFRRVVLPELAASSMIMSIGGDDAGDINIQGATELGVALLLGKPLIVVVPTGTTISDGLRRAADVVVDDFDANSPNAPKRINAAMQLIEERAQL